MPIIIGGAIVIEIIEWAINEAIVIEIIEWTINDLVSSLVQPII